MCNQIHFCAWCKVRSFCVDFSPNLTFCKGKIQINKETVCGRQSIRLITGKFSCSPLIAGNEKQPTGSRQLADKHTSFAGCHAKSFTLQLTCYCFTLRLTYYCFTLPLTYYCFTLSYTLGTSSIQVALSSFNFRATKTLANILDWFACSPTHLQMPACLSGHLYTCSLAHPLTRNQ